MALLGNEHRVVPDGCCTLYTGYVDHWRVIIIARPDAHDVVGSVANRPVITEIVGGASLGSCWTYRSSIAVPAILLRVRVQLQHVAIEEFRGARCIIAEHIRHHICQLWADDLLARIEGVSIGLSRAGEDDFIDSIVWHMHASIGEGSYRRGVIDQVHAQTAKHQRIAWRSVIAADAHILRRLHCVGDAYMLQYLDRWYVQRVLQGAAQGHISMILMIVVYGRKRWGVRIWNCQRDRLIDDGLRGRCSLLEGRDIDIWLERGTWLAIALRGYVELPIDALIVIVDTAEQRKNCTGMII